MLNTDKPELKEHLKVLCAAYNVPLTDEREMAFWYGVHHARLSEVVANIAKLCAAAKKGVPVPRPGDLLNVQPADHVGKDAKAEAAGAAAEAMNRRNWDAFLRDDPELARIELRIAVAGRILARDHEGSPQYAEAVTHDRNAREARNALWRNRAGLPV